MNKRIVKYTIEKCMDCPFSKSGPESPSYVYIVTEIHCTKENKQTDFEIIPEWCPLEKAGPILYTEDGVPIYKPFEINGKKYLRGSAGSLVLECPKCRNRMFREPHNYFGKPPVGDSSWHKCLYCDEQMYPIEVRKKEEK